MSADERGSADAGGVNPPDPEQRGPRLGLGPTEIAGKRTEHRAPSTVIDPRPYRMMIGAFGLVLLVAFSIYQLTSHGVPTIGIPQGERLRLFAAPLAGSSLLGDANVNAPCAVRRHDPRALNLCLLVRRGPVVLDFFITGSAACEREVGVMQAVSSRFRGSAVQFAAVAVRTGPTAARAATRSHHWTIPVAYDRDGAVGALYGVAVCPLVELARPGGVVIARLVGDRWLNRAALAAQVQQLLAG